MTSLRKSIVAQRRCTWFAGHLSWFESMSCLGAKFLVLNQCTPAAFGEVLKRFGAGNPVRRPTGLENVWATVDSMDVAAFSQYLGEDPEVLRSQSLDALEITSNSNLHRPDVLGSPLQSRLRICRDCLGLGYHSSLHQLSFLKRCLIHDRELEFLGGDRGANLLKGLPPDSRHVGLLRDVWSGPHSPFHLDLLEVMRHPGVMPTKPSFAADISRSIGSLRALFNQPRAMASIVATDGAALALEGLRLCDDESDWKRALGQPLCDRRSTDISLSSECADLAFSDLDWFIDRGRSCAVRRLQCRVDGLWPEWRLRAKEAVHRLMVGHERCACMMDKSVALLPAPVREACVLSPALAFYEAGYPTCSRLVIIELVRHALSCMRAQVCAQSHSRRTLDEYWPTFAGAPRLWESGDAQSFSETYLGEDGLELAWRPDGIQLHFSAGATYSRFRMKRPVPDLAACLDALILGDLVDLECVLPRLEQLVETTQLVAHERALYSVVWTALRGLLAESGSTISTRRTGGGMTITFNRPLVAPAIILSAAVDPQHTADVAASWERVVREFRLLDASHDHIRRLDASHYLGPWNGE